MPIRRMSATLLLALAVPVAGAAMPLAGPGLSYRLTEGENINLFRQRGPVAAHVLLRNGTAPRLLVAFPAGNSGVALWFEPLAWAAEWTVTQPPQPVTVRDSRGRPLHGVRFAATITAPRLVPRQALATSVRYLRDYQAVGRFPPGVAEPIRWRADGLDIARDRLDGAPGYRMGITVARGRVERGAILPGADGRIAIEVIALTGDPPLTPLPASELLNAAAAPDPGARNALAFLSYREKFLAGSWRFNTYFGRDTLMSIALLMSALRPAAIEAGLDSVLARVSDAGEVAHEEGIGEFAVVDNRAKGRPGGDRPDLDYKMVDDDYMLGPVAAAYLLDTAPRAAARAYLARRVPRETGAGASEAAGARLVRNLRFVIASARPFADAPGVERLVAIKDGFKAGQWRDSDDGLGGGRFAYDVNAVLVPAALNAAARLLQSGLLDAHLAPGDSAAFARADSMAQTWRTAAPPLFRMTIPASQARAAADRYASTLGVPPAALSGDAPLAFHAIALHADGAPVPILHSDEGFALLFGNPPPSDLRTDVVAAMRPFPMGLMTQVGLLVANAAQAPPALQARFTPRAYHGAVVWSWQQALFAAGLERQLKRHDLPAPVRATLRDAQAKLWSAIEAGRAFGNSELWSWAYRDGAYRIVAFGAGKADVDESNAAQLWSTVYLAVHPPAGLNSPPGSR